MNKFKNTTIALALALSTFATVSNSAGIEEFQNRVNKIAAENGVVAPDVKKELEAQARKDAEKKTQARIEEEKENQIRTDLNNVSPIERIVSIDANVIRAIKAKDGKIMYLVDNGRFAFLGPLVDVWNRKELTSIDEIADAVSHIDLNRIGFKLEKVHHISLGTGDKQVVAFVDPQCGWCHKLISEINSSEDLKKNYKFNLVVLPVLGERSMQMAKKLYCAKTTNNNERFNAFIGGARAIDNLEQKTDCNMEVFNQTLVIARALGVQGVPFVVSSDGRFERGKPHDLKAFLEPAKK